MKKAPILMLFCICNLLSSCSRSSTEVWDDTASAGRYFSLGLKSLGGSNGDSRQVRHRDEFYRNGFEVSEDFMPLEDEMGNQMVYREAAPQPCRLPGEPGSGIPSIEAFRDPSSDARLGAIFKNIHFPYDSSMIKGDENLRIIHLVSDYMKSHRNVYIFVEGHTDERGSDAYNLALGTRRANTVRNLLVKEGVDPEHVYTVSYGKERPLVAGGDETSWGVNRRAQFKFFER